MDFLKHIARTNAAHDPYRTLRARVRQTWETYQAARRTLDEDLAYARHLQAQRELNLAALGVGLSR